MVNWLALGKRCPKRDDEECVCVPSSPLLFTTSEVCVRLMLNTTRGWVCWPTIIVLSVNRNSSKPSPSVFAQAEVPLPAWSAALQKPTPVQNCTHLPAHLHKWRGISSLSRALCRCGIYSGCRDVKNAGKNNGGAGAGGKLKIRNGGDEPQTHPEV